jgi:hypothetical protein
MGLREERLEFAIIEKEIYHTLVLLIDSEAQNTNCATERSKRATKRELSKDREEYEYN